MSLKPIPFERRFTMNKLFNYKNNPVRSQIIDGEIFFVAKDICDALRTLPLEIELLSK